jgi:hypothetical protein
VSLRSLILRPTALPLALVLYLLLVLSVHGFGVVGEVAIGWTAGTPPRVAVDLEGGSPTWSDPQFEPHAGHGLGPLMASQTRPTERIQRFAALPLAVNSYTGGPPDWPARVVHGLTGSRGAVLALHLALGAGLLLALAAFLRRFSWRDTPSVALLVLATDWCFLFYRRVLGGTELCLLAAALLLLWGLWARRWAGQRGELAIALGLGLGLLAKITFLPTAVAFGLAALLTRWDRPSGEGAARLRWGAIAALVLACTAPLWIGLLHGVALPDEPRVWSHDGLGMQLSRLGHGLQALLGGASGGVDREAPASLGWFLLEPLRWFAPALGGREVSWAWAWIRGLGWLVTLFGVGLAWSGRPWRSTTPDPREALLRFLSIALPLQLGLLWLANRDLHHLAQASPTVALLVGLACERLAVRCSMPGSVRRSVVALVLCLPLVVAGGASALRTGRVIESLPAPAITERGQRALVELLRAHEVDQLWTSDYDLYGVFELRAPGIPIHHAWGAASRARDRQALLVDLLKAVAGTSGHYLVVRPAAARIYDLAPSDQQVQRAAAVAGVDAVLVGKIDEPGWARLYAVSSP